MIIVGIDPGIAGAICFFSDGKVIDVIDMPTMAEGKKNKKQVNGRQIYNEITFIKNKFMNEKMSVIVEQVSAMPGQGVASMINFGQSFGVIKGICSAMELPIFYVRPAKWKKHFNLINSEKDASRTKVIEMFPRISNKLSRKKDNNKFTLLRKFLPLFLLPEKCQIMLFNKFPPSKEPIGIKFKKPKNKLNIPTQEITLTTICY